MIAHAKEGERINAPACLLETLTSYDGKVLGEPVKKWRHVFRASNGEKLVYTGAKILASQIGKRYDIRATVKRQETQWQMTRLSRPIINPMDASQFQLRIKRTPVVT